MCGSYWLNVGEAVKSVVSDEFWNYSRTMEGYTDHCVSLMRPLQHTQEAVVQRKRRTVESMGPVNSVDVLLYLSVIILDECRVS